MRGATDQYKPCVYLENISIHTPHAGSDAAQPDSSSSVDIFQSTLPMRGATTRICDIRRVSRFQSTLPMRRATRPGRVEPNVSFISIHTPHAGSDYMAGPPDISSEISIHTPHAGSDRYPTACTYYFSDFNPHSPCGERPGHRQRVQRAVQISIHTPHAGSDAGGGGGGAAHNKFQSTLPMRGATANIAKTIFVNLYDLSRSRGSIINI